MDFRTFVRILLANWKLAMTALLMCTIGAAAITAVQTKHYQASTTVLISFAGATDLWELYNGTLTAQERLSSYAQIAGGRTVAEKAISQLQVPTTVDDLVANTTVKYTAKSMLLTITVKDTDPRRAAALAGAMADQFAAMVPTLAMNSRPGAPPTTTTPGAPPTETETTPPPAPGQPPEVNGVQQFNGKPAPTARARVIEPPRVPEHAYSPAPVRNMAMGLVSGLLLAVTVALVRETTDRTVRNREKLERLSGLPTLGELPGKRGGVARFGTDVIFDDAVRDLRARLRRAMGPQGRRVLLVAPFGGEGTTTTVLNLGRAFAELGEDVLVIEGDTRRPSIAGLLNVESGEGLASALAYPQRAVEVVKPSPISRLFILASRSARRETSSVSVFAPEVIDNVLAGLSSRFGRIIIDGPPVLATADAALLAGAVQATLLVVRAGRTTVDELNDALTTLRAAGAEIVGTILTEARPAIHNRAAAKAYRAKVSGPA